MSPTTLPPCRERTASPAQEGKLEPPRPTERTAWARVQGSPLPPPPLLPAPAAPKTGLRGSHPPWHRYLQGPHVAYGSLSTQHTCNSRLKNPDSVLWLYFFFFRFPPHHLSNWHRRIVLFHNEATWAYNWPIIS